MIFKILFCRSEGDIYYYNKKYIKKKAKLPSDLNLGLKIMIPEFCSLLQDWFALRNQDNCAMNKTGANDKLYQRRVNYPDLNMGIEITYSYRGRAES